MNKTKSIYIFNLLSKYSSVQPDIYTVDIIIFNHTLVPIKKNKNLQINEPPAFFTIILFNHPNPHSSNLFYFVNNYIQQDINFNYYM